MPLDPKAEAYLKQIAQSKRPPIMEQTLEEARQAMIDDTLGLGPEEPVAHISDIPISDGTACCMARAYVPYDPEGGELHSALVYYHGGGWVTGDIHTHDRLCRTLANRSDSLVFAVDYRLAPEFAFPAAVQDACAAFRYVLANAKRFAVDPGRVSVAGDSAGGNLAAAVTLAARNNQWLQPATQILVYPITDCDFETGSYNQFAEGYGLTKAAMQWFWDQYVPNVEDRRQPYVSPMRSENLNAVAPALILTAEFDALRDEAEAYARRLEEAQVPVRLKRYDGQIHGFLRRREIFDQAEDAIDLIARTVKDGRLPADEG